MNAGGGDRWAFDVIWVTILCLAFATSLNLRETQSCFLTNSFKFHTHNKEKRECGIKFDFVFSCLNFAFGPLITLGEHDCFLGFGLGSGFC